VSARQAEGWGLLVFAHALLVFLSPLRDATIAGSTADVEAPVGCPGRSQAPVTISGQQAKPWFPPALTANTVIDARTAKWIGVADSPLRWGGGNDLCWTGGFVQGLYPETESWSRMHDTKAMRVGQRGGARPTVERFHAVNYGDGISLEDGAEDFVIRDVHLVHMRDDCVENDFGHGGRIEDSFFEGCYVWVATRPRSSIVPSTDGADRLLVIEHNVAWMEPMQTVYSGPAPSTSAVFKVDRSSRSASPKMILRHNVLRVDVPPGVGNACLNPRDLVVESVHNVVVWLGPGDYPCLPIPDGWTLTRDKAVWDRAVADWKARHHAR
jgi:hypothetical protein